MPADTQQLEGQLAADYRVLTQACGLLDRSERGKLASTGAGAIEFLNGQVTNELAGLRAGEGRYAAFLTHKGKMLGDLRILAVANAQEPPPSGSTAGELLLDTERCALQALFDMIRRCKVGYTVELHKRTLESGLIALIGPKSDRIAHAEVLAHVEHANVAAELDGISCLLVRTELGVDVFCDAADTARLTAALRDAGAAPVGEAAAECLRIERGQPRYGVDIDDSTIPQEAGLNDRAVSFTKGCYVGQETVARLYYRGRANRQLRGLRLSAPASSGDELRLGARPVGRVGSVTTSPTFGPIALALVRREAQPGSTLSVGSRGIEAEVSELPFATAA